MSIDFLALGVVVFLVYEQMGTTGASSGALFIPSRCVRSPNQTGEFGSHFSLTIQQQKVTKNHTE